MLRVPAEAQHTEAVEEAGEATGPLGVMEVDGIYAGVGQGGCPLLGPIGHVTEEGRVDQPHVGTDLPPGRHLLPTVVAQPESAEGTVAGCPSHLHGPVEGGGVLHVERQLKTGADLGVELFE